MDLHDDSLDECIGMFPARLGFEQPPGDRGSEEDISSHDTSEL